MACRLQQLICKFLDQMPKVLSRLFYACAVLVAFFGCATGRPVPSVADAQAWLNAGVPVGSSKVDAIRFLKTHRIQGLSAQSDYEVRPYLEGGGFNFRAPRVIFAAIAAPPDQRTPIVWCQDELLISFDKHLRVTNRSVHQECVGP